MPLPPPPHRIIYIKIGEGGIGGGNPAMVTAPMMAVAGRLTAAVTQTIFTYFLDIKIMSGHSYLGLTMKDMVLLLAIHLRLKLNSG